jgi:hypothetical protein
VLVVTIIEARVPQIIDHNHLELTAFPERRGDDASTESKPIKIPLLQNPVLKLFLLSVEMLNCLKEKEMEDGKIKK